MKRGYAEREKEVGQTFDEQIQCIVIRSRDWINERYYIAYRACTEFNARSLTLDQSPR